MVPEALPVARQRVDAGRPERHRVHHSAREREGQVELLVLLEEAGLIRAGQVDVDEVGLGLSDLEDVGAVIRGVGGHHVVGHHRAAVLRQEAGGDAEEVVAEGVVGREHVPLGAPDQVLALLPLADGLGVHRVAAFDVEHEAVAVLAAQLVGVGPGVDIDDLVAVGLLADGERRGHFSGPLF